MKFWPLNAVNFSQFSIWILSFAIWIFALHNFFGHHVYQRIKKALQQVQEYKLFDMYIMADYALY